MADNQAFAAAQTDFAVGLLREAAAKSNDSVVVSPVAVAFALSLPYAGAAGDTRREFERVFAKGDITGDALDSLFRQTLTDLTTDKKETKYADEEGMDSSFFVRLGLANRAYAARDLHVKAAYRQLIDEKFGGHFKQVDFGQPAKVAEEINAFVAEVTHDKIRDLLNAETIDAETRLLLVNAVYFKGQWVYRFEEEDTKKGTFYVDKNTEREVNMMESRPWAPYDATDDVQVLELPFTDFDARSTFTIFLPKERFGLADWLQKVDGSALLDLTGRLKQQEVNVELPRFSVASQFGLKEVLEKLGFSQGFKLNADFNGIADEQPLFISEGVHMATIEASRRVNEQGCEAAAAVYCRPCGCSGYEDKRVPVPFRADHPFAFLITYEKTPLFFGRYMGPSS